VWRSQQIHEGFEAVSTCEVKSFRFYLEASSERAGHRTSIVCVPRLCEILNLLSIVSLTRLFGFLPQLSEFADTPGKVMYSLKVRNA